MKPKFSKCSQISILGHAKRSLTYLILLYLMLVLYACNPATIIPTHTPATSQTPAMAQSLTPSPSSTFVVTQSPQLLITKSAIHFTPTSIETTNLSQDPSITWAKGINNPIVMDGFRGVWSPVANEIVGIESKGRYTTGSLVLAQSPNFTTSLLDTSHPDSVWHKVSWSPDGKNILYGVVPDEQKEGFLIDIHSDIWKIEVSNADPRPTRFTGQRALDFWGWMDNKTVVFTTYHGGGHEGITEWNINTDQIAASDTLSVYSKGALTDQYAPVTGCESTCTAYVLTRNIRSAISPCGTTCQSKEFPRDLSVFPPSIEVYFQDWLPGGEKMLVAAKGCYEEGDEQARLFLWDITSDQLDPVSNGGIYGAYSSDGKWLIWGTYGPADQKAVNPSGAIALDPIKTNEQAFLNLQDLETKQTVLSFPVFAYSSLDASIDGFVDPLYTLSPDNQWLTLLAPGRVQLDSSSWPIQFREENTSEWSLVIINLKDRQLAKSIEVNGKFKFENFRPAWSPDSSQFVFQDETGQWHLYQVKTGSILPITERNGDLVKEPSWSYDGRYLQMISETPYFECNDADCFKRTYVLDIGNDEQ